MKTIFKDAVKNYLESIEVNFGECKVEPHYGYVSKISIKGDENYDVFVVVPVTKLDYIAELWFGDSSEYDKDDLTKEIANLIVGNAKMLAEEKGVKFDITTPEFLGEYEKIEYDDILKFKFKNRCFYVIFKEK
jgi:chemotaxis protein CheY-P-specific phosphatase CheC